MSFSEVVGLTSTAAIGKAFEHATISEAVKAPENAVVQLEKPLKNDTLTKQENSSKSIHNTKHSLKDHSTNTTEPHETPVNQPQSWLQQSRKWMPGIAASTALLGGGGIVRGLGYLGHLPLDKMAVANFPYAKWMAGQAQWAFNNPHTVRAYFNQIAPVLTECQRYFTPVKKAAAHSNLSQDVKPLEAEISVTTTPETNLSKPANDPTSSPVNISGNQTVHVVIHHHHYSTDSMPKPTKTPEFPVLNKKAIISTEHPETLPRIEEITDDAPGKGNPKAILDKPSL